MSKRNRKAKAKSQTDHYVTGTYSAMCHRGATEVMKIGEASIWAGRWAEMDNIEEWDLRIRFTDRFTPHLADGLLKANRAAEAILGKELTSIKYPPTLDIDWEDYSIPFMGREWWVKLVEKIKTLGPVNIAVYCHGGHGRTGTALSILAALSEQTMAQNQDAVEWVRQVYCDQAVESSLQITYVERVTETEIKAEGSAFVRTYTPASSITPNNSMFNDSDGALINHGDAQPEYYKDADDMWQVEWIKPNVVTKISGTTTSALMPEDKTPRVKSETERSIMKMLGAKGSTLG